MTKIGAGTIAGTALGSTEAGAAAGLILGVIGDPIVKSKLAIVLNKLQKKGINVKESAVLRNLLLEETSRLVDKGEDNDSLRN